MALVTLTDLYANLNNWPGNLLSASDGVTIGTHTATSFAYTYVGGTNFAGFTVTSTGTGFTYDGTTPTGGTMTGLAITDASGHLVLSVSGIAAGSLASDLSLFAAYEFGWTDPGGGGSGAQVKNAWSQLLSGNDTINGTAGNDNRGFVGVDAGNDVFNMGAGDDVVYGGLGSDTINGGDGWDRLDYSQTHWNEGIPMVRGITVTMDAAITGAGKVLDPYGFIDHFNGIEAINGSAFADKFTSSGADDSNFYGLRGADTFVGDSDSDYVRYDGDTWLGGNRGIIVNLQVSTVGGQIRGTIKDGFGNLDHTVNIQCVTGTRYADVFNGSSQANEFQGGEGIDSYNGKGGIDTLFFGDRYADTAPTGIVVNLGRLTGQIVDDGFGNVENAILIENVEGGNQNDRIIGNTGDNTLVGHGGDDTLTGGGGHDSFKWRHIEELGGHDVVTDFHAGSGVEQDVLTFKTTTWGLTTDLHFVNGTHATTAFNTFIYNVANHELSWDSDGIGAAAAIHIATLNNVVALTADNFVLY